MSFENAAFDIVNGNYEKLQELISQFISPDGTPRPGVTSEQLEKVLAIVDKYNAAHRKAAGDIAGLQKDADSLSEDLEVSRNFWRDQEAKGRELTPLLRSMYGL